MEEVSIKIKQQQMGMDHKTGFLLNNDDKMGNLEIKASSKTQLRGIKAHYFRNIQ